MSVSFPSEAEARAFAVEPGSLCWERASDLRTMLGAGPALLLQVAHPTVGAGVAEHSDFQRDPWGRLFRTLDFVNMIIYGGPEGAARTGRAVREMHKRIKGFKPDGSRYHALEPEAYAWVHATLAWTIIDAHGKFGAPFTFSEKRTFWRQWLGVGHFLGVREGDLPTDWPGVERYVDTMIEERLEDNDTVRTVLASLEARSTPPFPGSPVLWPVIRPGAERTSRIATAYLLPPRLRAKLGLTMTRGQLLEMRALGRVMRASGRVLPRNVVVSGPNYLRWRREEIGRGAFGPVTSGASTARAKSRARPSSERSTAALGTSA
jgi:uncharacterized protein (DUF2236 family)